MPMELCVVKSFKKLSSQEEKCVCTFFSYRKGKSRINVLYQTVLTSIDLKKINV